MSTEIRKAAEWGDPLLFMRPRTTGKVGGLGLCYSPVKRNMDIKQDKLMIGAFHVKLDQACPVDIRQVRC